MKMIKKLIVLSVLLYPFIGQSQPCYDASLSDIMLTPSDPAILNEPLTITFTFCNDLDALPDDDLSIVFTPNLLTPVDPPSGDAAIYFNWTFSFGTWFGTQIAEIPSGLCFPVTTTYIVNADSDITSPQIGTNVNITPSGIMSGTGTGSCTGADACFCVEDDNISAFTWTTNSLPVELFSFDVVKRGNESLIRWSTSSEINTEYFDVEKSRNGISFIKIERIISEEQSNSLKEYQTTDQDPFAGINYYRLKMVDLDGTIEYSAIKSLEFGSPERGFEIFPNPASEWLNIHYQWDTSDQFTYEIIDTQGKKVIFDHFQSRESVGISGLVPGIYLIRIFSMLGEIVYLEQFVKSRS